MGVKFNLFYRYILKIQIFLTVTGTPPFSAEVVVVIKIVSEDIPVFKKQLYTKKVMENVELFTPLLTVKANSPQVDKITGQAQKLIYSIEAGNEATDVFYVDPDSGMMSNIASLDFETKRHHQLRVRATDSLNGGYSEAIGEFYEGFVCNTRPKVK